ncbi:MAG: HlyD family type I secretion periplasmic adaptor subunit [Kiloniellales bacterium]|nr:HlyD family type I secretion periplasmic adaptor subunit [Kiloniellales bacterium]
MAVATPPSPGAEPPSVPLNARPAVIAGLVTVIVGLGGFGAWASLAPLESAAIAPGTIIVDSNRKQIQHLDGGIVAELVVRDGDHVEPGDVLLRLDETRARSTLAILESESDLATAVEARLLAERDGAAEIRVPERLIDKAERPEIAALVAGQQSLFEARRDSREGEVAILEQRVLQLGDEVVGLEAQAAAKARQSALIADELKGLQKLFEQGHAPRTRILALQREAARLDGERGELIARVARTRTAIGETKLQVIQLNTRFQEDVIAELRDIQASLFDLRERIAAARHVVEHIDVRAPVAGKVVGLSVHTIGGVIQAGDTILEIVPGDDRLLVEARVQPIDIDNVLIGQEADVRITAFKQRSTPVLIGEVIYLSADALTDPRSGEPYYTARVAISDAEVARLEGQLLQPGMPAEVIIKTGERTALDYLVQPILESANRAWRED